MPSGRALFASAAVALIALAAGIAFRWQAPTDRVRAESVAALTRTELPDLSGQPTSIDRWRGRVLVVNFWASWCAPCRDEIPGLVRMQQKYAANGLQIVGIAVDSAAKSREAAGEMKISYPVLVGGMGTVDLTRELGNRVGGLPYTLILDRQGQLVGTHLGILTEPELEHLVRPLLG